ncbi:MAG TPA: fatty acid--CoA ligase family protein, partial [Chloroflexota bacterium]
EVREVLRTSGAHVIITSAGEASQPNLPRVRWMPIADGLAFGALEPADFAPEPASSAFLCQQTSGSMGASKLALRTRDAVLLEISSLCDALALRSADVVMTASSVAHSYGCVGGLLAPLVAGASVVLTVGSRVESDLTATSPTILFGLGATYQALLAGRREPARGLTRIRLAFSAGAPLPDGLYQSFKERFDVQIRQDYGATEVGTISMDLESPAAPDTVGQVLPHIELDVLPPDVIALRGGERGEILVRSRAMAMGYLVDGRMVACTDAEGWYHTRDAGSFAGRSLVLGRRLREPIQVNGGPLDLEVVENEIRLLSGVLEVVAAPESSRDGLGLAAFVVAPTLSEPDIQRWCSDHLPEAHRPKRIVLLRELPRSPAGKILQKYLN